MDLWSEKPKSGWNYHISNCHKNIPPTALIHKIFPNLNCICIPPKFPRTQLNSPTNLRFARKRDNPSFPTVGKQLVRTESKREIDSSVRQPWHTLSTYIVDRYCQHEQSGRRSVLCCRLRRRSAVSPYWIPDPILSGSSSPTIACK